MLARRSGFPGAFSVDGLDVMLRVARRDAAVFLVAESNAVPAGIIRAVYDGSRALIHLLSVDPNHQRCGLGRGLVDAAVAELRRRGASMCSVTVTEPSAPFWAQSGFSRLQVFLMLRTDEPNRA